MKKCIIFCAGGFDALAEAIENNDLVIAADGGMKHTQALGITPQIILGDFDSLGCVPAGAEVFPVEKDDTDAMLAIKRGLALGCEEFVLYGSLDGDRLEHTVANFQALQYLADRGAKGTLVGLHQIVTLIKEGEIRFPAHFEGYLSVFCHGADATGVTVRNLHYNVENTTLTAGFPLGVSNRFVGKEATVSAQQGSLLLIWQRQNGLAR
jgi:thiamine pyrophosphokinase